MDDRDTASLLTLTRQAREALDEISRSPRRCPDGVDRFDWSSGPLDELARVALGIGDATAALAGERDEDVEHHAQALATAIVRRRNQALKPLPVPRSRLAARV